MFDQSPVGGVEDVTDQKEDDRGHKEVEEVESLMLVVGLLKNFHVKMKDYWSNVWKIIDKCMKR